MIEQPDPTFAPDDDEQHEPPPRPVSLSQPDLVRQSLLRLPDYADAKGRRE